MMNLLTCFFLLVVTVIILLSTFNCLTVAARVGDRFGTNIHWTAETQPGETAMLAKAFKIARMDFSWSRIEQVCGKYDFSAYDGLLALMKQHGVRPYWIVDYGNQKCYPCSQPNSNCCDTPSCIAAYGRFAQAAAEHYAHAKSHIDGNSGIIFETVNEPNGMGDDNATTIAKLIEIAWPHFAERNMTWVGPTTSGIPLDYLQTAFEAGILNSMSAVSVHPYRSTQPETAMADFAALDALIKANTATSSPALKIYAGEWGYTSATPQCNYGDRTDIVTQGKYCPRMWLTDLMSGVVEIGIAYDWHDDGPNPSECEQNFGSVFNKPTGNSAEPFLPKPFYKAALQFQNTIGNAAKFDSRIPSTSSTSRNNVDNQNNNNTNIFVLKFVMPSSNTSSSKNQSYGFAVWHADPAAPNKTYEITFDTGIEKGCWQLFDTFGDVSPSKTCVDNYLLTLNATNGPVYLV